MKAKSILPKALAFNGAALMAAVPALAVEPTGTPGSPSATTTIDGKQLPPPPQKFEGKIGKTAQESKPYWPARVVPPKGAPNILLIMTDDAGYGVASTFGGVIPTPALDRIAANGLRYTNFHSTALSSPTRAAIITGRNHHSSGYGVVAEQAALRAQHEGRVAEAAEGRAVDVELAVGVDAAARPDDARAHDVDGDAVVALGEPVGSRQLPRTRLRRSLASSGQRQDHYHRQRDEGPVNQGEKLVPHTTSYLRPQIPLAAALRQNRLRMSA